MVIKEQDRCKLARQVHLLKVATLSVQLQLSSFTVSDCVEGVADVIGDGRFEYVFGMVHIPTRLWLYPNISLGLVWKPAQAFTQLLLKVSTTVMLVHCWLHTLVSPMSRPHELTRRTIQKTTRIHRWYVPPELDTMICPLNLIPKEVLFWLTVCYTLLQGKCHVLTPEGQLNRKQSWINTNTLS